MSEINHLVITATVTRIDSPKQTPAGMAHQRLWLEHRSRQLENGHPVATTANIAVRLLGDHWTKIVATLQVGSRIQVEGYLSAAGFKAEARERLQLIATRLERL